MPDAGGQRSDRPLRRPARQEGLGVTIACGSDAGVFRHGDNAREIELLVECGMTPVQALAAATIIAARVLGKEKVLGSIRIGASCGLVVLAADPLADGVRSLAPLFAELRLSRHEAPAPGRLRPPPRPRCLPATWIGALSQRIGIPNMAIKMAIQNGRSTRRAFSIAEARADLADIVHDVESGEPVTITRRGKAVAVILSAQAYADLKGTSGGLWAALQRFRKSTDLEQMQLGPELFADLRERSPGRDVDL